MAKQIFASACAPRRRTQSWTIFLAPQVTTTARPPWDSTKPQQYDLSITENQNEPSYQSVDDLNNGIMLDNTRHAPETRKPAPSQ